MASDTNSQYPTKEELEERAERGDPVARLSVPARRIETGGLAAIPGDSRTARRGRRMSASIMRLARKLGKSPDELAASYSDDTVRRTKYDVVEDRQPDGSVLFKHIVVKD